MNGEVRFVGFYLQVGNILCKLDASLFGVELRTKESVETVASVASVVEHADDVLVARYGEDIELFHNVSLISLSMNSDLLLTV